MWWPCYEALSINSLTGKLQEKHRVVKKYISKSTSVTWSETSNNKMEKLDVTFINSYFDKQEISTGP